MQPLRENKKLETLHICSMRHVHDVKRKQQIDLRRPNHALTSVKYLKLKSFYCFERWNRLLHPGGEKGQSIAVSLFDKPRKIQQTSRSFEIFPMIALATTDNVPLRNWYLSSFMTESNVYFRISDRGQGINLDSSEV